MPQHSPFLRCFEQLGSFVAWCSLDSCWELPRGTREQKLRKIPQKLLTLKEFFLSHIKEHLSGQKAISMAVTWAFGQACFHLPKWRTFWITVTHGQHQSNFTTRSTGLLCSACGLRWTSPQLTGQGGKKSSDLLEAIIRSQSPKHEPSVTDSQDCQAHKPHPTKSPEAGYHLGSCRFSLGLNYLLLLLLLGLLHQELGTLCLLLGCREKGHRHWNHIVSSNRTWELRPRDSASQRTSNILGPHPSTKRIWEPFTLYWVKPTAPRPSTCNPHSEQQSPSLKRNLSFGNSVPPTVYPISYGFLETLVK